MLGVWANQLHVLSADVTCKPGRTKGNCVKPSVWHLMSLVNDTSLSFDECILSWLTYLLYILCQAGTLWRTRQPVGWGRTGICFSTCSHVHRAMLIPHHLLQDSPVFWKLRKVLMGGGTASFSLSNSPPPRAFGVSKHAPLKIKIQFPNGPCLASVWW